MTIQWNHWPRSAHAPELCRRVAEAFVAADATICSPEHELPSNKVLAELTPELKDLGFRVEIGKSKSDKVFVPVLYSLNGEVAKHFDADAYHESAKMVLEVEAGRAVSNNQFLKDLFQACMMNEVEQLVIAVRNVYTGGGRRNNDFDTVSNFFDTLYASQGLELPLRGVTVIGY